MCRMHFDANSHFSWGNYYNTRPIGSNDPRPVFFFDRKSQTTGCLQPVGAGGQWEPRVHCLFDEWGYIVRHTSWGHNLNSAAFGTLTEFFGLATGPEN
jgi:hypothetical protein